MAKNFFQTIFLISVGFAISCNVSPLSKSISGFNKVGSGNAKVFQKSPVFTANNPVGYSLILTANGMTTSNSARLNYDNILVPVVIEGTQNGHLENDDFVIYADVGVQLIRATPNALGDWNFTSGDDPNKKLGQVMAYHWLTSQKKYAESVLPNSFAASNKRIKVYSYCNDPFTQTGIAFYDTSQDAICMGFFGQLETAYDASIYVHEMAHGNIHYATNRQMHSPTSDNTISCFGGSACCPTANGCSGAIDEGQADYFSFMVFNSPVIAEFFTNSVSGLASRHGDNNLIPPVITAQSVFAGTRPNPDNNGFYSSEVHDMGAVWGTSLWAMRKKLGPVVADKLYLAHLPLLTSADTFVTASGLILQADAQLFAGIHQTEIRATFQSHGITPP